MEKYDFANASTHLYNFVYDDFTSWYLEFAKLKLQSGDEKQAHNALAVLLEVLKSVLLMIYPYTPFIAEEIYLNLPEYLESIMVDRYPEVDESRIDEKSEALIADLIAMIKDIRAYKVGESDRPERRGQPDVNSDERRRIRSDSVSETVRFRQRDQRPERMRRESACLRLCQSGHRGSGRQRRASGPAE